ncbi:MAG: hypothetical protein KZQ64_05135 [gamma proteobacterium symbiont of Bathyaustriella thionipta]|nr:hypothetical protein [gamma proteobacterium symbiont of Bathyaustriella thionipta]MCU7950759.1 hypothetical protein [gamma proteobacterium symbiont of Bathyaustriella thionipta]MCU7952761.1 hypothetical protein [gamma proteobacterium symbiont of Bathyaustriella thionipta]MCU7957261.1 hypothetical protein [gamma proteobacterium symbiont of Bathyaustriella thionipta]MCU7968508.1 hypothetical protein [gamma proteobacterium symbiont of Bathyaustriella thionipta]
MKYDHIKILCQSLNHYEKAILQQSRDDFEHSKNVRFTNLESYINHLASAVIEKQHRGEFVPRSLKEAQAGYVL